MHNKNYYNCIYYLITSKISKIKKYCEILKKVLKNTCILLIFVV